MVRGLRLDGWFCWLLRFGDYSYVLVAGLLIVCVWRCVVVALGGDYVALRYAYWFRLVWVYCYSSVV